jgi:Protein of unknown function (DUF664)
LGGLVGSVVLWKASATREATSSVIGPIAHPGLRAALQAGCLGEYQAWCARYRDLVACLDLDTPSKRPVSGRPVTLRWILFHLVEETARTTGTSTSSASSPTA